MSFFEFLKKFLSPVVVISSAYFDNMLVALLLTLYAIFSLEIFKNILNSIEYNNQENFWFLLYFYVIVSIIVSIVRFSMHKTGWGPMKYNGSKIYYKKYLEAFIQAEGNEVEKIGTGRFIAILQKGVQDWIDMLFVLTFYGLQNLLFVAYALFSIFGISFYGGILSFILLFLGGFVAMKANVYMRDMRNLRTKSENEASHQAVIALMSKNELMQNNSLDTILSKINVNFDNARKFHRPVSFGFVVIEEFPKLMFLIIRVGVYIYLSKMVIESKASFSDFAIFITIISIMEASMLHFFHILRDVLKNLSSVELLWSTFGNLTPIKGFDTGSEFKESNSKIVIKDIDYGYTEKNVFDKFSLEIEGNKKTAFVGLSGSGKTTLMKLIAAYIRPQNGTIDIFGNDLSKTSLKSYFKHIGYLSQEPSVFDGSIRENLQASVSSSTVEEDMIKALKDSECEFVFDFKDGIDTEIGEKGIRLSGGQRQRLAIAKIFIKNPNIILLDEPTSALDSFSEEKITKAMHRLFFGRTVIIIAHRLQTVKEADDIIVIEEGKVVERGTHRELIKKKGIYNKMLDLQSGF